MNSIFNLCVIIHKTTLLIKYYKYPNLKGALYMPLIQRIALVLTIIGAINWGLIGFFEFDLVAFLFGGQAAILSRIVYSLVGIAGLINIGLLFSNDHR